MSPLPALGVRFGFAPGPVVDEPIRGQAGVDALAEPDARQLAPEVLDAIRIVRAALGSDLAVLGFCGAPWTLAAYLVEGRGVKDFPTLRAFAASEPAALDALLAKLSRAMATYLVAQARAGADAVQIFDSWVGLLSLADWKRLVRPHLRHLLDAVGAAGVPRILFLQNAPHLIDAYAGLPAEVLAVDWRADLAGVQRRFPDRAVQGNIDPRRAAGRPRSHPNRRCETAAPDSAPGPHRQPGPRHSAADAAGKRGDAGGRSTRRGSTRRGSTRRESAMSRSTQAEQPRPTPDVGEPDIGEKGRKEGKPISLDRRLFMKFTAFANCARMDAAAETIAEAGVEGALYADAHDATGIGIVALAEDPGFFVTTLRSVYQGAPFTKMVHKPAFDMLGRTYSIGYESDLKHTLLDRPRSRILDPALCWAVWYPLQRSKAFLTGCRRTASGRSSPSTAASAGATAPRNWPPTCASPATAWTPSTTTSSSACWAAGCTRSPKWSRTCAPRSRPRSFWTASARSSWAARSGRARCRDRRRPGAAA